MSGRLTLSAAGVKVHFSGVRALDGVDLELAQGEIVGLIGPNGAGKTTLVNVVSGFQRPTEGEMRIGGSDATRWSADRFARAGLARTFQGVRLFSGLSVLQNVELGGVGVGSGLRRSRHRAWELLRMVGLADRADMDAAALPQGDANLVGICRALATDPSLVLLDEPAAGLNEEESDELLAVLLELRERLGVGLLVVEHDMRLIMRLCDRVQVLDYGRTLAEGTPLEVREDPAVVEAYLGTGSGHGAA